MPRHMLPLLLALSATSLGRAQAPSAPTEPQVAAYARSRMRAMTCTRDGRWMVEAEGGVLVLVDTWDDAAGQHAIGEFLHPGGTKAFQVGERGVLASALLLDPDAADEPVDGAADLLYVAGGRDGLWVAQADTRPQAPNAAWRVDDAQGPQGGTQDGARWCADVATARVGGEWFLLALFAAKDDTVLRVYPLADVRALAQPGSSETGHELAPATQVSLAANPRAPAVFQHAHFGRSLGLALAVDEHVEGGLEVADAYVALGHHGLARVLLRPGAPATVDYGPVFGTGSSYANDTAQVLIPDHLTPALYGNLVYEHAARYLDMPDVDREELPVFTDVAVLRTIVDGHPSALLFAAVDHLFWVAFDLDAGPFGSKLPLAHHEGEELAFTPSFAAFELHGMRPPATTASAFAAGNVLEVVEHSNAGAFLVVSTWRPFAKDYLPIRSEGVAYDADFGWGGGAAIVPARAPETFVYRIGHDATAGFTFEERARIGSGGGPGLAVPTGAAGQDLAGLLRVFHHSTSRAGDVPGYEHQDAGDYLRTSGAVLDLVRIDGTGGIERFARPLSHAHGAFAFHAVFDRLRPDLVLVAQNDAGVPGAGLLRAHRRADGTWRLREQRPAGEGPYDERLPVDLLLDGDAQLVEGHAAHTRSILAGGGVEQSDGTPPRRWQWARLRVPPGPQGIRDAVLEARWTMRPPRDAFDNPGRAFYMGLVAEPRFDEDLAAAGVPDRLMWGTVQRTPEGVVAIDRDAMLAWAQAHGEDGADYDLDALRSGPVFSEGLVTHPEFSWMPRGDALVRAWWQDAQSLPGPYRSDPRNVVQTWPPEVFQVRDPLDPNARRWVLAVPCGTIQGDPQWNVFDADPTWAPRGIYHDWLGHGLVQFFELWDDPQDAPDRGVRARTWTHPGNDGVAGTADDVPGCSPLARLIPADGPRTGAPRGNVWKLRHALLGGRQHLFCVDFAGRLVVADVEDVLTQTDPEARLDDATFLVETWHTPDALADDLPSALFDVAVQPEAGGTALVYCAVRRVGVCVLRFDPAAAPGARLVEVDRWQTAEYACSLDLRVLADGSTQVLVCDNGGGLRLFAR